MGKININDYLSFIPVSPKMMVILKNEVKKAFPLLDGIYSEERRILHNGIPVWIRQEGLREIQYLTSTFSINGSDVKSCWNIGFCWNVGFSNLLPFDFRRKIYSIDLESGFQEASNWKFFNKISQIKFWNLQGLQLT